MRNAEILAFPKSGGPPPLPPADAADQRCQPARARLDIGLAEIAHRLGLDRLQPATIVKHLRNLAASRGFPLPRSTRFWQGQPVSGPRLIVTSSVWNRYEVDKWFEDRDPPAARAGRSAARRDLLRAEMQARAAGVAAPPRRIAASC